MKQRATLGDIIDVGCGADTGEIRQAYFKESVIKATDVPSCNDIFTEWKQCMTFSGMTTFPCQREQKATVSPMLRPIIDQAINLTLETAASHSGLPMGAVGRCADFAIVGAKLLSQLTGHHYRAVSGGAIINCGSGRFMIINPSRNSRRGARILSDLRQYHCWIEAYHKTDSGPPRLEIVDFTLRHDSEFVRSHRQIFNDNLHPLYRWDFFDSIEPPPREVIEKIPHCKKDTGWTWELTHCTQLVKAYEKKYDATFKNLADSAFLELFKSLESLQIQLKAQ